MTAATTPAERWRLGYRPALDGLRGVAVLLVIVGHIGFGLDRGGRVGVTLFFVLSGFLITSLLVQEHDRTGRVDLRAFYLRRARRLLPALFVVLGVVGLILIVLGRGNDVAGQLPAVMFYVGNWVAAFGGDLGWLLHTWSLAVEEQFYIVWPVAMLVLLRLRPAHRPWIVAVAVVAILVWRAVGDFTPVRWEYGTDTRGDAILIGCLLALVAHRAPPRWAIAVAAFVVVAMVPMATPLARLPLRSDLLFIALAGAALVAAGAHGRVRSLEWPPIVRVGQISYGLYLWHHPVLFAWREVAGGPDWLTAAMVVPVTIAAAALSYRYVEQPFLRRGSVERKRDPAAAVERPIEQVRLHVGRPR